MTVTQWICVVCCIELLFTERSQEKTTDIIVIIIK